MTNLLLALIVLLLGREVPVEEQWEMLHDLLVFLGVMAVIFVGAFIVILMTHPIPKNAPVRTALRSIRKDLKGRVR